MRLVIPDSNKYVITGNYIKSLESSFVRITSPFPIRRRSYVFNADGGWVPPNAIEKGESRAIGYWDDFDGYWVEANWISLMSEDKRGIFGRPILPVFYNNIEQPELQLKVNICKTLTAEQVDEINTNPRYQDYRKKWISYDEDDDCTYLAGSVAANILGEKEAYILYAAPIQDEARDVINQIVEITYFAEKRLNPNRLESMSDWENNPLTKP